MPEPTDDKGTDDKGTDDKGTEGAPANGPDSTGDDAKGAGGKPNGNGPDDKSDDDPGGWKARSRQHEDASKARKKELDAAAAERDGLKGVLDGLRKVLDPDSAKDADPAELAKQASTERDQARAEARLARVELTATRAAVTAGANVAELLDSRAFLSKLADLDPTEATFATQVEDAVKQALKDRPSLKATPPAPKTGNADMSGAGSGGSGATTKSGKSRIDEVRKEKYGR